IMSETAAAPSPSPQPPAVTPLHNFHEKHNARIITFAGHLLPVQYRHGIIQEHNAARENAALFDVSHMGQTRIKGENAAQLLAKLLPLVPGAVPRNALRYSFILTPEGKTADDLILARLADDEFILVLNAARKQNDRQIIQRIAGETGDVSVTHLDGAEALLALQGPDAAGILSQLAPDAGSLNFMRTAQTQISLDGARIPVRVARCGYTGEDGFEISVAAAAAETLADRLTDLGAAPAGLGARDTLRLEAALPLYGHELDENTSPLEVGLAWAIPKTLREAADIPCIGGDALADALRNPDTLSVAQVALVAEDGPGQRRPVREGAPCLLADGGDSAGAGVVTSGTFSPSLGRAIALARVPRDWPRRSGVLFHVHHRGQTLPFRAADAPFVPHRYRRRA
ncbi:MAG: glycine cleavage system aminomethyltransferase GcvT, partial [Alphaproteobacteria bacterium]|nr:glycine cleavage system aminomethyltransferase GcvT [Alphaproteobacteria bacterium]